MPAEHIHIGEQRCTIFSTLASHFQLADHVSVTFDAFMHLALPIPSSQTHEDTEEKSAEEDVCLTLSQVLPAPHFSL